MAALAACPCCAVVHMDQVTPVDTFFCERGVLELMVEWREKEGNAKKPHGAMFPCGRSDVTRVGGSACREEGGCSTEEEQCLIYTVTAPFYHAMVPFLIPDKKIYDKTVEIKTAAAKIKKDSGKNNARVIEDRQHFERRLDSTFAIFKQDFKANIKKCPVRYFS